MLCSDVRRSSFQRQHRVARGLGRVDLSGKRQGKGAKSREKVRDPARVTRCLPNAFNKRSLPIRGGLQEAADGKVHRKTGQGDRRRNRLVERLGSEALVNRQPGEPVALAKGGQRLHGLEALRFDPRERKIGALVDEGQLYFTRPPRLQKPAEKLSQGRDEVQQFGPQNVVLSHVDYAMGLGSVEPDDGASSDLQRTQAGPAAAVRW